MNRPARPAADRRRGRWAVAYWAGAILLYAGLGALFQPFFLLGFWESVPFLLLATWLASRLFPLGRQADRDPG